MSGRTMPTLGLTIVLILPGLAEAQHHSGGHGGSLGGGHHHGGGLPLTTVGPTLPSTLPATLPPTVGARGAQLAAVSGGYAWYGFGWPYAAGPGYFAPYSPVATTIGPAGFFTPIPPPMPMRGPLLPPPPPPAMAQQAPADRPAAKPAATDPDRVKHYLTFGDRLFRAGNLKKATERYLQARDAGPDRAAPQLRLAQVAMARGQYAQAADRLRDAETAEPGWLLTAPDIQAIYGEPAAFLSQIARLESHVQSHPDDRDAWLVLGAEWFLSGRTARAADVFARLDDPDRRPDVALAAFLFASDHARPKPGAGQGAEPTR